MQHLMFRSFFLFLELVTVIINYTMNEIFVKQTQTFKTGVSILQIKKDILQV